MITKFNRYLNEAVVNNSVFNSNLPTNIKFTIDLRKSKIKDRLKIVQEFEKYFIFGENRRLDIIHCANKYLNFKFYDSRMYKNVLETRKNIFTYNFSSLKPEEDEYIFSIDEFIDVGLIEIDKYIEFKKDTKNFNL